jgi:hypothetical protein
MTGAEGVPPALAEYLAALPHRDEAAIRACLAQDIERIGPYGDVYRGRDEYAQFLAATIGSLAGYELVVDRIVGDGHVFTVELSETVDDPPHGRLRTQEAVVFDLDGAGLIERVAVYLRTSEHG